MTVDLDGKRWEPVPGATATAEDFIAARSLLHEIHQQCLWSPWVMQDRAVDYDAALKTCGQWASSDDPFASRKTLEEYEADLEQRLAEADARFLAAEAQAERDRAERTEHYDPVRAQARLALLEQQGILADKVRQRDEILSGQMFPLAEEKVRRRLLAALERDISAKTREVDDLAAVVGDPETVTDAKGWLPAERREMSLTLFKARRGTEVRDLRARIAEGQTTVKSLKGRSERAGLHETLRKDKARLAYLEQIPRLEAAGMCSECVSPAWYAPGVTFSPDGAWETGGPCPAWPRWTDGVNKVREAVRQAAQGPPKALPPPQQPIAVLASGTSIEEMLAQLTAIQAGHPGAQVRQGRGRRWEIWPAPAQPEPTGH
jgi:hypothetical protein